MIFTGFCNKKVAKLKNSGPPKVLFTTLVILLKYLKTVSSTNLRVLIGLTPKGKQIRWLVQNEIHPCFYAISILPHVRTSLNLNLDR